MSARFIGSLFCAAHRDWLAMTSSSIRVTGLHHSGLDKSAFYTSSRGGEGFLTLETLNGRRFGLGWGGSMALGAPTDGLDFGFPLVETSVALPVALIWSSGSSVIVVDLEHCLQMFHQSL